MEPIVRSIHTAWQSRNGTLLACSVRNVLRASGAVKASSASLLALSLTLGATTVHSADALPELAPLEEVVITAQFREQSLQEVPVAITALDSEQLDTRSISSLHDLTAAAPNLIITRGTHNQGPAAQTFIRGVGQFDGHLGFEPGVGLYLDDVYYGVMLGSDFELSDSRVEILRGPQGTLAGKNSIGGSIKLFTTKPSAERDGYVSASYGDYNRVMVKGAGNITLTEGLYMRLSGYSKQIDGYMDRIDYGCTFPNSGVPSVVTPGGSCKLGEEGGEDTQAARIALRYAPGGAIENNLTLFGSRDRSDVPAEKLLLLNNAAVPGGGSQYITGPESYTTYSTFIIPTFTDPARYNGQPGAGTHPAQAISPTNETDSYGASNTFVWTISEGYALTSITGYRDNEGSYGIYQGGGPYAVSVLDNDWTQDQFTQELRLNGTSFGKLDWTVGGYYYDQDATFGGLKVLAPGTNNETLFQGNDPVPSTSTSGFVHAIYHVTQPLSLIAGARYTDEEKTYTFQRQNPYAPGASFTAVGAIDGATATFKGDNVDYRAGVQYDWTPSIMTYLQFSTGFRGGGVNVRPFVVQQLVPFNPETVDATELGFKTSYLENRLRVNGAVFFNKYEDILFGNTTPTVLSTGVTVQNNTPINAGDAEIKGAELEVSALFGGLQVDASASYLDFEFTRIGAAGATIPGVTLSTKEPYAPESKYTLGVQYSMGFSFGQIIPRIDADYQDEFFTDITNTQIGLVNSRTLVNARLTWTSPEKGWSASLVSTNVTDKFYYVNKFRNPPPTNFVAGQPGAPRQIWGTIQHNF